MLYICYENCSNCKSIEKSLRDKEVSFIKRDIKENNPTVEELREWHEKSGLELKKFFNTSGTIYREQKLKNKIIHMTTEEQYQLLSTSGMLVKRPIVITDDDKVYVGLDAKKFISDL